MNKLLKMFSLAVMLVMGGHAMAQTHGTMFLGASFPMKDYGKFDGFNEFSLTAANESYSGAAIGFNAGLKWYYNVGVKGLGVMLSVDGFYNGPNSELKAAYRESTMGNQLLGGSFTYDATPKYINVPAMLGLNYLFRINPQLAVYVEAGAGGNFRFITDMQTTGTLTTLGITTKTVTTQNYDNAFTFAYQAGIGIEAAKNFVIGCSFYNLGAAQVNGEQKVKTVIGNGTPETQTNYYEMGTMTPIMVLGRIGFKF